jgi:hypothetical protein
MDAMMMRLLEEANAVLLEDDNVTLAQGLGSPHIDFMWNVAAHSLMGAHTRM